MERLINRHIKFDYTGQLKRHCRSKTNGKDMDLTQLMDNDFINMSVSLNQNQPSSPNIFTQMSRKDFTPRKAADIFQDSTQAPPCFQDLECSHSEVSCD